MTRVGVTSGVSEVSVSATGAGSGFGFGFGFGLGHGADGRKRAKKERNAGPGGLHPRGYRKTGSIDCAGLGAELLVSAAGWG